MARKESGRLQVKSTSQMKTNQSSHAITPFVYQRIFLIGSILLGLFVLVWFICTSNFRFRDIAADEARRAKYIPQF